MLSELGGFPVEIVQAIRVPGLPVDGGLVTRDAEIAGIELPWFFASEVSKVFFAKDVRWFHRFLSTQPLPPLGHPFYFEAKQDADEEGTVERRRWTLAEVERMVCWLLESHAISYRKYITGRQTVAWIARGHGVYDG